MNRAVFLDRDGVINRALTRDGKPYPPRSIEEVEIIPGVPEALRLLHDAGFLLIVVTNQPDVARGTTTREVVDSINGFLAAHLAIDDFRTCYHDDREDCACRKPRPGLLVQAASDYSIKLNRSWMIGDRWRDIDAGHAVGCRTILIDYGYQERGPSAPPDAKVASLRQAADVILAAPPIPADTGPRPDPREPS